MSTLDTVSRSTDSSADFETDEPELPFTIGRYQVERRLGRGGMGIVYEAWDARLHRRVALKQVRPDSHEHPTIRRRFLREARAAARLDHPAIARVYDLLETPDADWIVMELAIGRSLDDMVRREPLRPLLALSFAVQIADGLAAAHDHGIVHRDLKSENIVLTAGGRLKILDFGLAKPLETSEPAVDTDTGLSRAGQLIGTPRAMSPEQARGYEVDARSDLFSLGSLLYEMLTGEMPFHASSPLQSLTRVCTFDPPPPSRRRRDVPAGVDEAVARLLRKAPDERPQSAREALLVLQEAAATLPRPLDEGTGTGFVPIFLPARPAPMAPRSPRDLVAVFLGGVVLGCAVAAWFLG